MRFRARVDRNQKELVRAIRDMGASAESLARLGDGFPDLLVGISDQVMVLAEIKSEKGKLTPTQVKWRDRWRGPAPYIVRSIDDAVVLVNNLRDYAGLPYFVRVH